MKIILVRSGEVEAGSILDSSRNLSQTGIKQVQRAAKQIKGFVSHSNGAAVLFDPPFRSIRQSAEIIAGELGLLSNGRQVTLRDIIEGLEKPGVDFRILVTGMLTINQLLRHFQRKFDGIPVVVHKVGVLLDPFNRSLFAPCSINVHSVVFSGSVFVIDTEAKEIRQL